MLQEWANAVLRIETEKRRLEMLRYLLRMPGYEAEATLLRLHCGRIGVPSTVDQTLASLHWLAEQELVTVRMHDQIVIGRITMAGREVADGSRSIPGVMRPDP